MVSSSDDVANSRAKLLTLARLGAQAWLSCVSHPRVLATTIKTSPFPLHSSHQVHFLTSLRVFKCSNGVVWEGSWELKCSGSPESRFFSTEGF